MPGVKGRTFRDQKTFAKSKKELKGLFKKSKFSKTHTMKIKSMSKRKGAFGKHSFKVDFVPKK